MIKQKPKHFRSKTTFLGIPLLDISTGGFEDDGRYVPGIARGWIAIGDIALGILAGIGGVATGLLALGGLSIGLLLAFGGLAIGSLAVGGLALGLWAIGGMAIALFVAVGGTAIAVECAAGGLAIAEYANQDNLRECVSGTIQWARAYIGKHFYWFLLPVLLVLILLFRRAQKARY